jgi:hypothetical protein
MTLGQIKVSYLPPYSPGYVDCIDDHYIRGSDQIGSSVVLLETDSRSVSLRNRAIAKANQKVRDQKAGLGETLAELRKTSNMITKTVLNIAYAARDIRRGRFASAARKLDLSDVPKGASKRKRFQDNWLAYRYGWTPLYSTVYGSMQAIYDIYHRPIRPIIVRGSCEDTIYSPSADINYGEDVGSANSGNLGSDTNVQGAKWKVTRFAMHTIRYEVGYIYRIDNPTLAAASSLGLSDPVAIAWELVPLSFVVDWFTNIGDVLGQLGAFTGKTFLSGYETFTCRTSIRKGSLSRGTTSGSYVLNKFVPATYKRDDIYVYRKVLTSVPLFGIHLENGLNTKRLVDAIALLGQRLR